MADEPDKKPDDAAAAAKAADAPKYMTADEYNKASTAREKRLLDKIQEMMKAKPAEPVVETDDADETDDAGDETDDAEPAAKPAKKEPVAAKPSKADIAGKKALQRVQALEKAGKEEREKLQKEKADLLAKQEKSEILSALQGASAVQPAHALAVLKSLGRVVRNDDGDMIFNMPREAAGEKYEEPMSLSEGVKEWLGTDEGKVYAPPKGAEGSGASASQGGGKTKSLKDMSRPERKRAAGQTLMKWALNRG